MGLFPDIFMPRPGRFGTLPTYLVQRINTGTLAAGTATHNLGTLPAKCVINKVVVTAATYPTAATNCTITLVKRDVSAAGDVTISNAIDVNGKTAQTMQSGTLVSSLTPAQKTLETGDQIKISMVTTGAVSVQPVDLVVSVELLVLA